MTKEKLDFVDSGNILPRLDIAIKAGHNIALRGKTGTGKTHLIRELAKSRKKKLYTLNMTVNTTVDEIKGSYVLKPGKGGMMSGEWHDGTLVNAMKEGAWLCIEEAKRCSILHPHSKPLLRMAMRKLSKSKRK